VHPVAAAGFSAAAEVYERARPSYPPAAVAWISERAALAPGRTVLDLGAGTGKLTRLLVPTGARVIAVEPVAEMRAKLREVMPGVEALEGTAEDLPLPDGAVDVVTCAQAFHWFNLELAVPELYRVLADDGLLVLVWNTRDLGDPLHGAIEALLSPARGAVSVQFDEGWLPPLEAADGFGAVERRTFMFEQLVTREDIVDRVASTSFVAAMPQDERDALLAQVRGLVADRDGPFSFPYLTEVFAIPRLSDRGRSVGVPRTRDSSGSPGFGSGAGSASR
jgi:SAM-dependent methyltransferase